MKHELEIMLFTGIKKAVSRSGAGILYYMVLKRFEIIYQASLSRLSPVLFVKRRYKKIYGRSIKLRKPETFDEKLLWLMLYWKHPLKTECADKYTMRSYVEQKGWGHILPELLGVYENSSAIDYDTLPDKFVLKCTHGCGFNIICTNKEEFVRDDAKTKLDKWMKIDYSKVAGELHYHSMKPRIINEKFLDDLAGELPVDYKVFCFDGKVHCTLIVQERKIAKHQAVFDYYDREWKTKLPYSHSSLRADRNVGKPAAYDEMLEVAEVLSKPFPFVRMDFYDIKGKAILGEMTFTPSGGIDKGFTDLCQSTLGNLIKLPPKIL